MEWLALTYIISVQYIALLVWEYNIGHNKTRAIVVTRRPIVMEDYDGNLINMRTHATTIAKYSATMVSLNKSQQLGIEIHYTLEGANLCVRAFRMHEDDVTLKGTYLLPLSLCSGVLSLRKYGLEERTKLLTIQE